MLGFTDGKVMAREFLHVLEEVVYQARGEGSLFALMFVSTREHFAEKFAQLRPNSGNEVPLLLQDRGPLVTGFEEPQFDVFADEPIETI